MGKEVRRNAEDDARSAAENLFSPSRLEIKDRQTRATNCLGRMTAGAVGAGL